MPIRKTFAFPEADLHPTGQCPVLEILTGKNRPEPVIHTRQITVKADQLNQSGLTTSPVSMLRLEGSHASWFVIFSIPYILGKIYGPALRTSKNYGDFGRIL